MKKRKIGERRKLSHMFFLICLLLLIFVAITSYSTDKPGSLWESLPTIVANPADQGLEPVWASNGTPGGEVEILVFIEPFCRTNDCLSYISTTLIYLAETENVHLTIYDYPISQESKSFMLSAAGQCVVQNDKDLFFEFLERAAKISDRYDNNLEIQLLAKELLGEYDRSCVRREVKGIKTNFENKNPLQLQEVPATVIEGRIIYGNVTEGELKSLIGFLED
ncbi:MAG: thioredoxin domain-containing protein [Anaerolineaceae bacterium]|nr:thioredoxin domain-containing protein [Anaerolineaceae bacterium]